jgi:hypothetical protein
MQKGSKGRDGVVTKTRLRSRRRLLSEWVSLNRTLGRRWAKHGDAPWWYNERALLSVLVGAVWLVGGHAFEEYSEIKRRKKKQSPGRIDLWFSLNNREFWAEAKHGEIGITNNSTQIERAKAWMRSAKQDVRRCIPDAFTNRLAIVFAAPYLRPGSTAEVAGRLEWFLKQTGTVEHDAMAWVFPKLRRIPRAYGWISPGIVVWVKAVRR